MNEPTTIMFNNVWPCSYIVLLYRWPWRLIWSLGDFGDNFDRQTDIWKSFPQAGQEYNFLSIPPLLSCQRVQLRLNNVIFLKSLIKETARDIMLYRLGLLIWAVLLRLSNRYLEISENGNHRIKNKENTENCFRFSRIRIYILSSCSMYVMKRGCINKTAAENLMNETLKPHRKLQWKSIKIEFHSSPPLCLDLQHGWFL